MVVDPRALQAYGVPLERVVAAVKDSNNDVGGRLLELTETEHMVRGRGYVENTRDLENVVVGVSLSGTPILVGDIGRVELGPDIRRGIAEKDGKSGAGPMKRMAAPMIGGLVTSTLHTLVLIPVYYALYRRFEEWRRRRRGGSRAPPGEVRG